MLDNYHQDEWNEGIRVLVGRIKTEKNRGRQWVFFMMNMNISPVTALFLYKRCLGIEPAYNKVHALEEFTKGCKHAVRVFLTGLAFLLLLSWILLNWQLSTRSKHQRNKNKQKHVTINPKRFKITITLPCFHISLLLGLLITIGRKNGNQGFLNRCKTL
ncbi:MAG: hypothetical protein ACTSP4_14640 [Candidatus Hodarchaeales archaeon]